MNSRGLTIATLVLAALLGALYWSNKHPKTDDSNLASPTPSVPAPEILKLNEADVIKIELKKNGNDEIVLAKDSNGNWQISAPKTLPVDDTAVSSLVSALSSLNSERLVEEKATNPGRYGLAAPKLEINITDKNSSTHKLFIGDDTPTGSGAYAQLGGDSRVFTIASYTKTSLDKGLNDLRDKRLITADADKITRLQLVSKQQTIEFSRDKEQWQILHPKPLRADGAKVDELVRKITEAQMDLIPNSTETPSPSPEAEKGTGQATVGGKEALSKDPASAFTSGLLVATARLTTDTGTQQIEVRKHKDDYYAKSSISDGTYKVASDLGEALDKKLDHFRNKKPFGFGFDEPGKIEIRDGDKTLFLTKGGEDWWSGDGKKYERSGVDALISKLRDTEANEFTESGPRDVALQVTVTSSDGKRVDKVALLKTSNNTLARLEGESSLYVLNANFITDIQKLLSELKTQ